METIKIIFIHILLIGVSQNSFSQQLKTYQGAFKNGDATYQYYDTDNGRIYQGPFKYVESGITIIGQYDKNKKSGIWITTKVDKNSINGKVQKKEILTGKYNDDLMEGLWTIERTDLEHNETLLSSRANFKDGYLTGIFKYYNFNAGFILNNIEQINELSLIGSFSRNGDFDSIWIADYKVNRIPFEFIRKFKNGLLYFELKRNLATGEIITKYDDPTTPVKFPHFKGSYEYSNKFVTCITNYPDELYSQVLNIWECIKTPNSYEYKKLNPYVNFSNQERTEVLIGESYNPDDYFDQRSDYNEIKNKTRGLSYSTIIFKADSLFSNKNYKDARIFYNNSLLIKSSDYVNSQIEKINEINRIESEKKDRENSKKLQQYNDSIYRESAVYKDQLKTQKEIENNKLPKYKQIIYVFKKK